MYAPGSPEKLRLAALADVEREVVEISCGSAASAR
jgi:hypothetical protein